MYLLDLIQSEVSLKKNMRVLSVGIILLLLMSSRSSLRASCSPNIVEYSPTPCVKWDPNTEPDIAGYTIYHKYDGGVWQEVVDLPCWVDDDGSKYCQAHAAVQKYGNYRDYEYSNFCIKAYNEAGNTSTECSNEVRICMPHIWIPYEHYY
jgi:hypothetical protein